MAEKISKQIKEKLENKNVDKVRH